MKKAPSASKERVRERVRKFRLRRRKLRESVMPKFYVETEYVRQARLSEELAQRFKQ